MAVDRCDDGGEVLTTLDVMHNPSDARFHNAIIQSGLRASRCVGYPLCDVDKSTPFTTEGFRSILVLL